jgi:hypothetical protein
MIVCANQMYGDMGIFSVKTMFVLASSYGIALRLPILTGVWAGGGANGASGANGTSGASVKDSGAAKAVGNGARASG